jgi:hypothetical protein
VGSEEIEGRGEREMGGSARDKSRTGKHPVTGPENPGQNGRPMRVTWKAAPPTTHVRICAKPSIRRYYCKSDAVS